MDKLTGGSVFTANTRVKARLFRGGNVRLVVRSDRSAKIDHVG